MRYTTQDRDDPRSDATAFLALIGFIVLTISVYLLHAVYYRVDGTEAVEKWDKRPTVLPEQMRAKAGRELNEYRFVDKERQVYAIPIDRAMQLEVERLKNR